MNALQCIRIQWKPLLAEGFTSAGSNLGKTPEEKHLFEESDSSRKLQICPLSSGVNKACWKPGNIRGQDFQGERRIQLPFPLALATPSTCNGEGAGLGTAI